VCEVSKVTAATEGKPYQVRHMDFSTSVSEDMTAIAQDFLHVLTKHCQE
jgi:hypothetical protein